MRMKKVSKKPSFLETWDLAIYGNLDLCIDHSRGSFFVAYKDKERKRSCERIKRPRMKLKKLQLPIKIEKRRKTSAKLRKRVVAKKPKLTATDIQMPEITEF